MHTNQRSKCRINVGEETYDPESGAFNARSLRFSCRQIDRYSSYIGSH